MDLMDLPDKPSTIHTDEALAPRGPWRFLLKALPGGFSFWGIQLIFAWVSFYVLTSLSWFVRLKTVTGNSAIANQWGNSLSAGDLWEIMENGSLQNSVFGFWTLALCVFTLLWVLWAGWKLQAETATLRTSVPPWLLALPVAVAISALPLWILHLLLLNTFEFLAGTGIPSLGWINLFAKPLLKMTFASVLTLQWWLCRIDLAYRIPENISEWRTHIKESFLRLWIHPVQWGNIVFFGVIIRAGLAFVALFLAWEWGGQILSRLWAFFFLQVLVAAINGWLIGWMLRVTALFWKHDRTVRAEVRALESAFSRRRTKAGDF